MRSILFMRIGTGIVVFLAATGICVAQEKPAGGAQPPAQMPLLRYSSVEPLATESSLEFKKQQTVQTKTLEVSGPLVRPVKAKNAGDLAKRVLQLFNPFAPAEPQERITRVGQTSSVAWTTTVGWSPGTSAFPDETTHTPSVSLVSASLSR